MSRSEKIIKAPMISRHSRWSWHLIICIGIILFHLNKCIAEFLQVLRHLILLSIFNQFSLCLLVSFLVSSLRVVIKFINRQKVHYLSYAHGCQRWTLLWAYSRKAKKKREQSCYQLYFFSDTTKMFFGRPRGVFWGRAVTAYNLNYKNAKRFCHLLGASLATYNQLYTAWMAGLEHCA